ncbi:MAG: thrombospondin type 3 repeat-containing protein [marine benthic group bacterium]|nr:thrombospondin type 3 repeat-containing protein [Gemmatimonadota bacterium]MCL7962012.1 thrombospondin type 3 repeat-containing protein [Candidatus Carthagonibacter metallireducens]MCL7965960.1 thrombospondin type 3 repeat-containing protein [Gemmatimonadota bacterium]MCL7977124.1 thrombospondin type 3 repeat-containing protein [Gemmatimonadota bacterium]
MKHLRSLLVLCAGLLIVSQPMQAQEKWGQRGLEINAYYGVLNGLGGDETEMDATTFEIGNNHYFGGRLGYVFGGGFGIEGFFGYLMDADVSMVGEGNPRNANPEFLDNKAEAVNFGGDLAYWFQPAKAFQIGILGGAGWSSFTIDSVRIPNNGSYNPGLVDSGWEGAFTWNYGAAAKFYIARSLAIRVDWRNYVSPDGLERYRCTINGYYECEGAEEAGLESKTLDFTEFSGGLSLFLGGPKDSDGDGVPDDRDLCPNTPEGVMVDENGCPFDDDMDGVPNYLDNCPDTPQGATVDAAGCPMDSDGDGVYDGLDQCPNTPAGATVDSRGCPTDSDGDGVYDGVDQCPNTPRGATVDATGCPLDSDGDGIYDGLDQCPGTPAGANVDDRGCLISIELTDVEFEFDSFELTATAKTYVDRIAEEIMSQVDPQGQGRLELRGHTDSRGAESYNQMLSEKRAQSVLDEMLRVEPGLAAYRDRISAVGFGETQPIASNDTDEGRQRNRRVEFHIVR